MLRAVSLVPSSVTVYIADLHYNLAYGDRILDDRGLEIYLKVALFSAPT